MEVKNKLPLNFTQNIDKLQIDSLYILRSFRNLFMDYPPKLWFSRRVKLAA